MAMGLVAAMMGSIVLLAVVVLFRRALGCHLAEGGSYDDDKGPHKGGLQRRLEGEGLAQLGGLNEGPF